MKSTNNTGAVIRFGLYGLLFGFFLSRMGFTNYDEIHKMWTFSDLRMFLSFGGGVVLIMIGFLIFGRRKELRKNHLHKGTVIGGLLFGVGWVLTGACPGAAPAQLGEGQLPALLTVSGIFIGTWLYDKVHSRFFSWNAHSCEM